MKNYVDYSQVSVNVSVCVCIINVVYEKSIVHVSAIFLLLVFAKSAILLLF